MTNLKCSAHTATITKILSVPGEPSMLKEQMHVMQMIPPVKSFRAQEEGSVKNAADPCYGCETVNIDCKAHNCTYNEHCKCTAASINVSGANAHRCCDTKCDTFHCEC